MRRPWNVPDVPVYSLATYKGDVANMNICTYVSAISMKPKQYAIAVYKNTFTLDLLKDRASCVLQLLNRSHTKLIPLLGKKSGRTTDKMKMLDRRRCLIQWNGYAVLSKSNAWIELKLIDSFETGGDHTLFYFEALRFKTNSERSVLTFNHLIKSKVIL